jgi:hypothetical protein
MPVYTERNRSAAAVILANPQRYGGALLEWARLVMGKRESVKLTPPSGAAVLQSPRHDPLFSNTSGPVGRLNAKGWQCCTIALISR